MVFCLLLIAGLAGIASAKAPLASDWKSSRPEAPAAVGLSRLSLGTEIPISHSELVPDVAKEIVLGISHDRRWLTAEAKLSEGAFRQWLKARELSSEYRAVAQVPNHAELPGEPAFEVLTHVRNDRLLVHESRRAGRVFRLVYDRQLQRLYAMRLAD